MKNLNKMKIAPDLVCEIGQDKPSWFPKWDVKDDATLYEKVNKLAHSTFDRSKFTVVGSPNITDDGIASGFSSSNYLTIPLIDSSKNFEIDICIKTGNSIPSTNAYIFGYVSGGYGDGLRWYSNGKLVWGIHDTNGSLHNVEFANFSVNTEYWIKLKHIDDKNYLCVSEDGVNYTENSTTSNSYTIANYFRIGVSGTTTPSDAWSGSIDLKQFSITVDGVEVFSGNKTGIDIIKPTNFTITTNAMKAFVYDTHTIYANSNTAPTELYNADGTIHHQSASEWQIVTTTEDDTTTYDVQYNGHSATYTSESNITSVANPPLPFAAGVKISADGVMSAPNNNVNWVDVNTSAFTMSQLAGKSWEIKGSYYFDVNGEAVSNPWQGVVAMGCNYCNFGGVLIRKDATSDNNKFRVIVTAGTAGSGNSALMVKDKIITESGNILWSIKFDKPTSTYTLRFSNVNSNNLDDNKNVWTPTTENKELYSINVYPNNSIRFGQERDAGYLMSGSIDLNAFKIYVDGNLVYQPCLKIPYTEAELNQKVVDVAYRPRVKDLFEQVGYNGYHTIDEDNKNFTLPTHKFSDVIKHKENGLTVAEQRVDQTLTIRGACEQGVDVNLPMEFFSADSYAVFGVGTTGTNTASKFTPAADGNYIAIGKGKV